jgi:type II secretory pathway pseudopilin PulG
MTRLRVSRRRIPGARRGVALLEAIVALAIFATAGIAALTMAAAATRATASAREADRELREASGFLEAVALWTRNDLDQRLGDRRQGPWMLTIERPYPELYLVTLRDTVRGAPLLETSLFRPEPARGIE